MPKKSILMIGTSLCTHGGVSTVVGVLKAGGLFERCEVEYVATHCDGGIATKLIVALSGWTRFLNKLAGRRVALLHVHMASRVSFWRKSLFILPAFVLRIPVVVHLHGGEFHKFYGYESSAFAQWMIQLVFKHAHKVIVLSTSWREWILEQFPEAKVAIVYNSVFLPERFPFPGRDPDLLLFLGRLGKGKGVFDLIEALARLVIIYPNIKLVLGGDGQLEVVRAHAASLGIATNVKILGWINNQDKYDLLARSSMYVLPSYNEGLPMSVLEAMAAGLPVVSTLVGGIPEAVTDGVEGYLISPGNVTALTDRLGCLLRNENLRRSMGEAARLKVEMNFSVERIVPQIEEIYRELLGGISPISETCKEIR
jgi:glycosyltransferase involved in cell wall biosynthesis